MTKDTKEPFKKKQAKSNVLTEDQKKAHHIASEQKRRENIRSEFDRIVNLTPSLNHRENRSELNILTKSADYIDDLKLENIKLIQICQQRGIAVPNELIYKGPGVQFEKEDGDLPLESIGSVSSASSSP